MKDIFIKMFSVKSELLFFPLSYWLLYISLVMGYIFWFNSILFNLLQIWIVYLVENLVGIFTGGIPNSSAGIVYRY